MQIDIMFLGPNADREYDKWNKSCFTTAPKTETTKPAIDPNKEAKFRIAIDKLQHIRQQIVDGKTDVKFGSKIGIDGFVFVV